MQRVDDDAKEVGGEALLRVTSSPDLEATPDQSQSKRPISLRRAWGDAWRHGWDDSSPPGGDPGRGPADRQEIRR